jgi:hypothetical protein
MPTASNLNYVVGQTIPNAVIAKLGTDGKVCLFTLADSHLVVDIEGWLGLASNQPDSNVTVYPDGSTTLIAGGPDTGAATIDFAAAAPRLGHLARLLQ